MKCVNLIHFWFESIYFPLQVHDSCMCCVLNIITKGSGSDVIVCICIIFRNTSKRGESFGISRIGNKIKGVFKSTTMEGAMLPSYGLAEGEDDMVS